MNVLQMITAGDMFRRILGGGSSSLSMYTRRMEIIQTGMKQLTELTEKLRGMESTVIQVAQATQQCGLFSSSSPDAIVVSAEDGIITYFNEGAERIFGFRRSEILGRRVILLFSEKYRSAYLKVLEWVRNDFNDRGVYTGKTAIFDGIRKNGELFPIETSLSAWRSKEGSLSFGACIRDLSEKPATIQSDTYEKVLKAHLEYAHDRGKKEH